MVTARSGPLTCRTDGYSPRRTGDRGTYAKRLKRGAWFDHFASQKVEQFLMEHKGRQGAGVLCFEAADVSGASGSAHSSLPPNRLVHVGDGDIRTLDCSNMPC